MRPTSLEGTHRRPPLRARAGGCAALLVVGATLAVLLATIAPAAAAPASITGRVDAAGVGQSGFIVYVYAGATQTVVRSTSTNATGNYTIPSLAPGSYRLQFWKPASGFAATWYPGVGSWSGASLVTVTAGSTAAVNQTVRPAGSLAGTVTNGLAGVSGDNVFVYSVPTGAWITATTTNASGAYSFPLLVPGTYRVQAWSPTSGHPVAWFQQGTTFANATNVVVPEGGASPVANINVATVGSVSGTVRHLGVGAPNISVLVTRVSTGALVATVTTGPTGSYSVSSLAPGGYRIAFSDPTHTYPAAGVYADQPDVGSATIVTVVGGVNLVADQSVYTPAEQPVPPYTGNPSGPRVAVIGDSITQMSTTAIHAASDAIANVSVRGINQQRIAQMQPVADKFATTSPDQVIIALGTNDVSQLVPIGQALANLETMIESFPAASCITVLTINNRTAVGGFNSQAGLLNGLIRALPATHPQVRIADWQRVRDAYWLAGEAQGPWTTDGIHLTPLGQTAYASLMTTAMGACGAPLSSLAGLVFVDVDDDGVHDAGEDGLDGITFKLSGADVLGNPVTRTTASVVGGTFVFDQLVAGTYAITEVVPVDLRLSQITIGTAGGVASTSGVSGITLAHGVEASGYEFANPLMPSSIQGVVYADLDADGAHDGGEPGIERVTLILDGSTSEGQPVHLETTSAPDGSWRFDGLSAGTYGVTEVEPNGFTGATTTIGTPFGGTGGAHTITGIAVSNTTPGTGYRFGEVPTPAGQWAAPLSSPYGSNARAVVADAAGDLYVTGTYAGSVTFGSGGGAVTLTAGNPGAMYLAKYNSAGGFLWATSATSTSAVEGFKLSVAGGRLVVAGKLDGSTTFGEGGSAVTLSGPQDAFVATYTTAGTLLWVRQVSGASQSIGTSAATDAAGNSYLTGVFVGSATFSGTAVSGGGGATAFIARYLPDGSLDWVRALSSPSASLSFDVDIDGSGNAVIGGAHMGIDFGGGVTAPQVGGLDVFVAQYLTDGAVGWTSHVGSSQNEVIFGVAVDEASDRVFVSGLLSGLVDFGGGVVADTRGSGDAFVAGLSPTGTFAWVRSGGGVDSDMATRLSVGNGRVNITGSYNGGATFGTTQVLGYGLSDAFAASYDFEGNQQWVRPIAGAEGDEGWGTATLASGDVVVLGVFALHAAVMPGPVEIGIQTGWFTSQFLVRLHA